VSHWFTCMLLTPWSHNSTGTVRLKRSRNDTRTCTGVATDKSITRAELGVIRSPVRYPSVNPKGLNSYLYPSLWILGMDSSGICDKTQIIYFRMMNIWIIGSY
jgi:hypothetical protein